MAETNFLVCRVHYDQKTSEGSSSMENKTRNRVTLLLHFCLLAGAVFLFTEIILPDGRLFGSETDWYCQHVTIADTMRKQFLETGELFPDWSSLGSGTNFYALSYYGFLRPDVLVSYFFPEIPVEFFIQGYALLEITAGAWLLYWWLYQKGRAKNLCLAGGFLYLTSNCMFQAHRQIMFVNYLPFLLLALICLDSLSKAQNRDSLKGLPIHPGLSLSLFMMVIHSFYFFPACFVCCTLYLACKDIRTQKRLWRCWLGSVTAGVSLAMIQLLPTALLILENKKDVKSSSLWQIFTVNPSLNTLLYSPYGCGLTLICLYCLLLSLGRKRTRKAAAALCILLCSQLCCWILNGTLYLRPKALIPFLPLILLLTTDTLEALQRNTLRHRLLPALFCAVPALIQVFVLHSGQKLLILADTALVLLFAGAGCTKGFFRKALKPCGFLLVFLLPALLFVSAGRTETYASPAKDSREIFSREEIQKVCQVPGSAFDILSAPMTNSNYTAAKDQRRTTMYSSVSNSTYNRLFYDILKMPVSTRNRVTMNADANPFQEYLMSVRYIQTTKDKLPAGYEPRLQKGNSLLAENTHVLPAAYGSTALFSEEDFDHLSYPQNLDTLSNRTVIPADSKEETTPYSSLMKKYPLEEEFLRRSDTTKTLTVSRKLPRPLTRQILLLSFDVSYNGKKDIDVTINGIRNRLSGTAAPYPNKNTTFTYMLSGNETMDTLTIRFSKGSYKISGLRAYTLPLSALNHPGIVPFTSLSTEKKELLRGKISMPEDGYFVTSFAFSNGYQVFVDGEEQKPEMVNKGFLGFSLKKGAHEISVRFHAPSKFMGTLFSYTAAVLLLARLSTLSLSSALRFPQGSRSNSYGVRPL